MCEIPNIVILVDEYSKLFDGFSSGSNDLTQLVLGADRDSALAAHDFDERAFGVIKMVSLIIQGARRNNVMLDCVAGPPAITLNSPNFWLRKE